MKLIVCIGLCLLALPVFSQSKLMDETDLPAAILEGFELAYPEMPPRSWEKKNSRFVATIKYDDRTEFATFLETGEWAETRTDIDRSALPETVISFIDSHYNAYRDASIQYVEENSGGIYYAVLLQLRSNKSLTTELVFDMGGEIQMVDGLPVYESKEGNIVTKNDENIRLKPGTQREIIDENQGIPEIVITNLRKRYGAIEKIEWSKNHLGFHRGAFKFREENIATEWNDEGNQASVITFFTKKNATFLIQKFLDENYPKAKFISGERVTYETKFVRMFPDLGLKSYFVIEISEKPRGAKEPIVTTVYFDQTGQMEMIVQQEDSPETE